MKLLVACAAAALAALSCQSSPAPDSAGPPPSASSGVKTYGAAITPGQTVPISKVVAAPDSYTKSPVIVEATVRRACSRKGCWMEVAEGEDSKHQGCRVTFKDYGFFVPKDSAGAKARVQGVVKTRRVNASEVSHLESEGATFAQKNSDGTATEVRIVATGVELSRR